VTPDSFSDGGRYVEVERALMHARQMICDGVDIIDIGGESTRPGAEAVSAEVETARVLPVIEALKRETDIVLSIDSSKAEVMSAAASAGVDLINDVRALREIGALEVASESGLAVCLMHMQGEPRTMQGNPKYDDLIGNINTFFEERIAACVAAGIRREKLILDVGFGFGKTQEHNLTLINQLHEFGSHGLPLLVGLSRKSTIGKIVQDRLIGSIAGALAALERGARILRVHDVLETVEAVRVLQSIRQEMVIRS
ncbi:MAG: dihydropteroate synthase, partial [Gammaproteobacteria bacterium]|nr:dihydropteroate synthase [Gammaproteobacteria bacterium]